MKIFPKANSLKDMLLHLGIMLGVLLIILFIFFYLWLPYATNHGETITVPKLNGMGVSELEKYLEEKNLRFEINDSTYVSGAKPYTVVAQHPAEGSKVKENRKIYVTIASKNPPRVLFPNIIEKGLRDAKGQLKSLDLVPGKIMYVQHPYADMVLHAYVNGKEITPQTYLPKGTVVDLQVANGEGEEVISAPDSISGN